MTCNKSALIGVSIQLLFKLVCASEWRQDAPEGCDLIALQVACSSLDEEGLVNHDKILLTESHLPWLQPLSGLWIDSRGYVTLLAEDGTSDLQYSNRAAIR